MRFRCLLVVCALAATSCVPGQARPVSPDPVPEAVEGGTLRVGITAPAGLDPILAHDEVTKLVVGTACQTLVVLDPETGEPREGLVEMWTVADGGGTIMFKIRQGTTFHDGTRVTSREAVESLRRLADPDSASYVADLMSSIAGFQEFREEAQTSSVPSQLFRGARVIEPYSFEVFFDDGPNPDFLRVMAHPATAPVQTQKERSDPGRFPLQPICAGPYRYAEPYEPGADRIVLERVDTSMGSVAFTSGGAGYAERIEFGIYPDANAAHEAWTRGEVDVVRVPEERVPDARTSDADSLVSGPHPQMEFIGLPYGQESPFNEVPVRQALARSLDREAIARDVYGGSRAPANGFLPPSLGEVSRPDACGFSRATARPADMPESITLVFNDEFRHRALAETVAQQWRDRLEIAVELRAVNWDEYLQAATTGAGFTDAFRVSWTPLYQSGLQYLTPLFSSSTIGSTNLQRYSSFELDMQMRRETVPVADEGDRDLAMQRVEDMLCRDMPLIPVVSTLSHVLVRSGVVASAREDGKLLDLTGAPLLQEMWIRQ